MHSGCAALAFFSTFFALVPQVVGHGYVSEMTIDGKTYQGNRPNTNSGASVSSPIRSISDVGPVKGANNSFLSCGLYAQNAAITADCMPGSRVEIQWSSISGGNWIHKVGSMLTYMASCGEVDCAAYNSSSARWFKIDEVGLRSNGSWGMEELYNGWPASVTIPANLARGGYLLRHELIALHAAMAPGGAEFYPSCMQLSVGGAGSGVPNGTVSFPGAYTDTNPGILVDAYDMGGRPYVFPGPPVSTLVESGNAKTGAAFIRRVFSVRTPETSS